MPPYVYTIALVVIGLGYTAYGTRCFTDKRMDICPLQQFVRRSKTCGTGPCNNGNLWHWAYCKGDKKFMLVDRVIRSLVFPLPGTF